MISRLTADEAIKELDGRYDWTVDELIDLREQSPDVIHPLIDAEISRISEILEGFEVVIKTSIHNDPWTPCRCVETPILDDEVKP